MTELAVTKISSWIKTNLDTYSTYALNHHRLHINRFGARATCTAESIYSSMKDKRNGGKANMCVHKSAAKIMDAAQTKGKDLTILDAQNVSFTRTVEK